MSMIEALRLIPQYHVRVWGGQHLKSAEPPIGEAWVVYEDNLVADGPYAGRSLADLAVEHGPALLGPRTVERTGLRFPILSKLLDTADWLSLQVHPNDEEARRLEGPDQLGKTEAWHILEADPEAQLIFGLRSGTTPDVLADAIRDGTILDHVQYRTVVPDDTLFIRAGTVHALGPGLLLYEVQQTSDITYRVFDWNRPQSTGRALHIDKSLAVSDPDATGEVQHWPADAGARVFLIECPYFTLEAITSDGSSITLDTRAETFHALTMIEGEARIEGAGWSQTLGRFESVVVPAECGAYQISGQAPFRALVAGAGSP